jgi:hypothetical protein
VVDGEHHGAARGGIKHPRHAVLHAPIELMRSFEIKARRLLRLVERIAFAFFVGFRHDVVSPRLMLPPSMLRRQFYFGNVTSVDVA